MAQQLAVFLICQAVGVVVGGENDHGIVQLSRLLQLVDQALHGQLQLHLAGQIGGHRLGIAQLRHLVPVAAGHGVSLVVVLQMAAHRQAIDHKLVLIHKLGYDLLHHLLVGGREILLIDLHIQAVADAVILVSHIRVGEVAVVVVIEVVVVGQGAVAQVLEQGTKAKGHVVVRRLGVAPDPRLGDQARGGHILSI